MQKTDNLFSNKALSPKANSSFPCLLDAFLQSLDLSVKKLYESLVFKLYFSRSHTQDKCSKTEHL